MFSIAAHLLRQWFKLRHACFQTGVMAVGDAECIGFSLGGAGGHISDGVVVDIFSIRKKFSCLLLADGGVPYTDFAMGKLGNVRNGS